ncbi:hypothetical protein DIS24_g7972 [Lasiodiplodia hormozganensis]|uniref:DUF7924 domain-containing protein n=1 Tax=Lasiodiplodia hormozganensis TaxID=869390 RepID=A0AA39Y595_9PEZI|nr:hypothetical protein DIS24_g7972 [Lasiodiplodia hormozganensis]
MKPSLGLPSGQRATDDDDNSSNGSSTPRGRPSAPNDSRKNRGHATAKYKDSANSSPIQRDRSNSPYLSSTGLTSSVASQGVPPSLPHIQLSTSHPKPEALKELIDHLTSPPLTSTPSEDTCRLVKQWRLSQYRDVREREHHFGPLLGWPSEYAMGVTSEFHMDKALHAAFAPQDAELERRLMLPPVRPTFTYGFTSTAFTAPQKALMVGMLDLAKVMPAGEDPQFPFLAQKWINDSDSRREAEREMARAGATMCRALSTFYRKVCKWEEVDVDEMLTFTMVVSPEVCRLFVNWFEKSRSDDQIRFHKDLVYAAFMEDEMQVQKMRTICDRIKDWMRDLRLMNLKDALDIMIDANANDAAKAKEEEKKHQILDKMDWIEEQRAKEVLTTHGSITNGLTTNESTTNAPITNEPSTNGSKPSEEYGSL